MVEFPSAVLGLFQELDRLDIPYAIGGSFASSAWGAPRQTQDLDLVVLITEAQALALADRLEEAFLLSRDEIRSAVNDLRPFRSFHLLYLEEVYKVDIFLLENGVYNTEVMKRRRAIPVAPGYEAKFVGPEDIVIAKLRWYALGDRVSDRQWNDIVRVLETQGPDLDLDYIARWATEFQVIDDFEAARAESGAG